LSYLFFFCQIQKQFYFFHRFQNIQQVLHYLEQFVLLVVELLELVLALVAEQELLH
jgi:hypothetical protein